MLEREFLVRDLWGLQESLQQTSGLGNACQPGLPSISEPQMPSEEARAPQAMGLAPVGQQ